jgi:spore coat protein A
VVGAGWQTAPVRTGSLGSRSLAGGAAAVLLAAAAATVAAYQHSSPPGMMAVAGHHGGMSATPELAGARFAGLSVARDTAPSAATIVIPKDGMRKGFKTKTVRLAQGGTLSVVSLDSMEHTVTADDKDANGDPLFDVFVQPGETTSIPAASKLAAGTYHFHCSFHPSMTGTLIISGGGGGVHPTPVSFDQKLVLPPVITSAHARIPIEQKAVRVLPTGPLTRMWTYGGTYPGPTIVRPAGHDTRVTYVNRLPKRAGAVTVHLHGDHHSSADDGQPTRFLVRHGQRRTYDYPLTERGRAEPGAFDFYHDHRMGLTTRNNWNGLQGMFIVRNPAERRFDLPSGRYDVPLLVSERSFNKHNQLLEPFPKHRGSMAMTGPMAPPDDATIGNHILVDGRYAPYLPVTAHRYRLRLLNASAFTSYDFELSDGRPFVQIGTGDALLPAPVVRQDILLGPSQRADVIVDFHGAVGKHIVLESVPRVSGPADGIGTPTAEIMQFRVRPGGPRDTSKLPSRLLSQPSLRIPRTVAAHWTAGLHTSSTSGSYWTFNGKPFDPRRVDYIARVGTTEKWVLRNDTDMTHYVHLHEELWHTIKRDGRRPPPWERGLEDTWRLDPGESVVVAARFTDYTGVFMAHCHMLNHEDDGLMSQFAVLAKGKRLPRRYHYSRDAVGPG